jgi:DNA-binding IclR family transcriptional regulator
MVTRMRQQRKHFDQTELAVEFARQVCQNLGVASPKRSINPASGAENGPMSAIGKAFAVLKALRHSAGPMTLTTVAETVGVAPSSAHSILSHLLHEGAVIQVHDKRYQLGPQLFYLGAAYARGTAVYRSTWIELVNTASELGVTAAVATKWNDNHLILNAHRSAGSEVALPFGGRVPLAASSWGKVYYAWSGEALPTTLHEYTPSSITDVTKFKTEVETTLKNGFATDMGEFTEGVGGVCAPVTSNHGLEGLASFIASLERVNAIGLHTLGRKLAAWTARASLALGDGDRVRFFGTE